MHTIVRNQEATIPTTTDLFRGLRADKAPRFDKMILAATKIDRAKSSGGVKDFRNQGVKIHEHLAELIEGKKEM
jgi:hypothetical protein